MRKKKLKLLLTISLLICIGLLAYVGYKYNGKWFYITNGKQADVVIKTKGLKFTTGQAKVLLSDSKSDYQNLFGDDIFKESLGDISFKDYAVNQVRTKMLRLAAMNIYAKENGIVLTRDQEMESANKASAYISSITSSEASALGVDKESITELYKAYATSENVYQLFSDKYNFEISADEARVINIQYICADSLEGIQKAKQRIASGEIFYVVAKEYNGNNYEAELRRGEMEKEFEDVAYKLKTGETSDIVEVAGKFYIIKCNSDNNKAQTEANKTTLLEKKKIAKFNEEFEPIEAGIYLDVNDEAFSSLDINTIKTYSVKFMDK